jgi:hypothetical protein
VGLTVDTPDQVFKDMQAGVNADQKAVDTATAAQQTSVGQHLAQREAGLAPVETSLQKDLAQPLPMRPHTEPLPEYKAPKPDPQEFKQLAGAMLAMALIGGRHSHGDWLTVSAALNGAMKGEIEGNKEIADKSYKEYETKFKAAQAKEAQANKEFEDILKDRSLTINQKLQAYNLAAAKYGRDDLKDAANQKSIDQMEKRLSSHTDALEKAKLKFDNDKAQRDMRIQMHNDAQTAAGGGKGGLSAEALDSAACTFHETNTMPAMGNAKNVAAVKLAIMNREAEMFPGGDRASSKAEFSAASNAYKQTVQRQAAVERITGSVQDLEPRITALTAKLNSSLGVEFANTKINDLARKYRDNGDLAELDNLTRALGRQYMEAVTMPGSNAQMHIGAQETADAMSNGNMPPGKLKGALKGINEDIAAVEKSMTAEEKKLHDQMRGLGSTSSSGSDPAIEAILKKHGL